MRRQILCAIAGFVGPALLVACQDKTPTESDDLVRLVVATQPGGAVSGRSLSTQPLVEVQRENGAVASDDNSTVVVASLAEGKGALRGQTEIRVANGVARYTDLAVSGTVEGVKMLFNAEGLAAVSSAAFDVAPPDGLAPFDPTFLEPTESGYVILNQLMAIVEKSMPASDFESLISERGGRIVGSLQLDEATVNAYQVQLNSTTRSELEAVASALSDNSRVIAALPAELLRPIADLDNERYLSSKQKRAYTEVQLSEAWSLIDRMDPELQPVRVGIIDSGLNYNHSEFVELLIGDQLLGINLLYDGEDWIDRYGHGTRVAGIIGAPNENGGMNGVVGPTGDRYELHVYRVGTIQYNGRDVFDTRAIIFAYLIAAGHDDVVNMSFYSHSAWSQSDVDMWQRLVSAGKTIFVAGAGNCGGDCLDGTTQGEITQWPPDVARLERFIVVAGTDQGGQTRHEHSNFGLPVALAAPYTVYSTGPDGNDAYEDCDGTSCSTPLVSGAAALLLQLGKQPDEIKNILVSTGVEITTDEPIGKRLNICRAVANALAVDRTIIPATSGESRLDGTGYPPSDLYMVEPFECGKDNLIGRIRTEGGVEPVITDLAVSPAGRLYGISFEMLYTIDESGIASEVGTGLGITGANALAFDDQGNLFGAGDLVGEPEPGSFFWIDTQTGRANLRGSYGSGYGSYGDIAFASDGTLVGAAHRGVGHSILVRIDASTGVAEPVGDGIELGFDVWGLAFVGDRLYGLSSDRGGASDAKLVEIDWVNGGSIEIRGLTFDAFGAGAALEERN